ncbi:MULTISPECIES: alpha-hydroxy-acid oxidizing protein [unclassified Sphingopyxis]|uniref:alpha-hydroxy-acid oxidizing protein n=1 Tax=unclassified Sphingopyxis TaxID=2614943 RepID=UPI00285D69BA|nr:MULTISPECIES: alpha-hydroxy-acid oxidizing protein [unclassified Sphingopyxis]MDR6832547.1 lactate 2-monooxygenase [Sphingopyxis sp. BE122]MDR7228290.1 lactate 2-monooxygenase [Sphingopyxis sp. BE259]
MGHYGDLQTQIYQDGLRGVLPDYPVDFATLEKRAENALSPSLLNYVQGGCGDEHTQRSNASAFHHWGMVPRMLVDCTSRDLSVDLLGMTLPSPIFMAPIGVNGEITQDQRGDIAAAEASAMTGVPFCASTLSNSPLEEVANATGSVPAFFQLYTPKNPDLAESLIRRAEAADYKALVITLDTWVTGWRPRDLNASNFPQLRGKVLENYFSDPVFRAMLARPPEEDIAAAVQAWATTFGKVLTWSDIEWFRSITRLPIILKGICHPDDALRAADHGVDAIYCSNHGGRQANGGIAAIDMLSDVVKAAGEMPTLFDSGVRSGSDVIKALALGAKAVGIGRPYAYGLAIGGAKGAAHVLRSILAEADLLMAVNGYPTVEALVEEGASRI